MKLEVGMYVKTIFGEIGKIEKYCGTNSCGDLWKLDIKENAYNYKNISKSSFNIIDLIEVGDYVNGYLVLFAGATTWDNDGNVLDKQVHINHNGYNLWLREEYIKSIVTKEQFDAMKYEVK